MNNKNALFKQEVSVSGDDINYRIKSMRYLGNKTKHLPFIFETVLQCQTVIGKTNPVLFDAFGGSGTVSQFFNHNGYTVISNDMNDYSFKLCYCRNSIVHNDLIFAGLDKNIDEVITHLNNCRYKGFVFVNYSPNTLLDYERKYFTNENAEIIDGIRTQIEEWYSLSKIDKNEHILLISMLIESVSLYSNIPGTYGAFNKQWDPRSLKKLQIDSGVVNNLLSKYKHKTYNNDLRDIINDVECDILYLDPPYNGREYSMYYHVLETISLYDNPILNNNKTGTKKTYKKSKWCNKKLCKQELEYMIKNTKAKCIIMSYNNEGLMTADEIKELFCKYGSYNVVDKEVRRFKCNENNTDIRVFEYIHTLIKHENPNDPVETQPDEIVQDDEIKTNNILVEEPTMNRIFNCCCLNGMKALPDNSVDLICTDLPYGLTECKWDTPIDIDELWRSYKRIIKPYGTIILFAQQPFTSRLVSSNYEMFKYSLVWQKSKPGGFAQAPYKFLTEHEDILIFSNGKTSMNALHKMTYNPQGTVPCNKIMKGKTGCTEHRGNRKTQDDYIQTTTNYPRSVLKFGNAGKTKHPTQKPLDLITYLVRTFSNENDIVLDSCLGSGTTVIACIDSNRQFVGYELDKKYFDVCVERIENNKKI